MTRPGPLKTILNKWKPMRTHDIQDDNCLLIPMQNLHKKPSTSSNGLANDDSDQPTTVCRNSSFESSINHQNRGYKVRNRIGLLKSLLKYCITIIITAIAVCLIFTYFNQPLKQWPHPLNCEINNRSVEFNKTQRITIKEFRWPLKEQVWPCDSFYEYICGNYDQLYIKTAGDRPIHTALDDVFNKQQQQIAHLLQQDDNSDTWRQLVQTFYRLCMSDNHIDHLNATIWNHLSRLGINEVLLNHLDNSELETILANIHTQTNLIVLFQLDISDVEDTAQPLLRVSELPVAFEYSATSADENQEMLDEIAKYLHIETQVCKMTNATNQFYSKLLALANKLMFCNRQPANIALDQLQALVLATKFNWTTYFTQMRKNLANSQSDEQSNKYVVVSDRSDFEELIQIISETTRTELTKYVIIQILMSYLPQLSKILHKADQTKQNLHTICFEQIYWNLNFALSRAYYEMFNTPDYFDQAAHIFRKVVHQLSEQFQNVKEATNLISQINETTVIGYPSWLTNDSYMNELHQSLIENRNADLQNHKFEYLEARFQVQQWTRKHLLAQLGHRNSRGYKAVRLNPTYKTTKVPMSPMAPQSIFPHGRLPIVNIQPQSTSPTTAYFPAGLLQPPFYHPFQPAALNLGSFGYRTAQGILYVLLKSSDSTFRNQSLQTMRSHVDVCKSILSVYDQQLNDSLLICVTHRLAIDITLSLAQQLGDIQEKVPTFQCFTNRKLTFMSILRGYCEKNHSQQNEYKILILEDLDNIAIAQVIQRHNEFKTEFKCA